MFTRCFERMFYNPYLNTIEYQVINISEYGFEYLIDGVTEKTGLVENLEETIEMLLDGGFEEVE